MNAPLEKRSRPRIGSVTFQQVLWSVIGVMYPVRELVAVAFGRDRADPP